jgi:hypothetical protein
VGEREQLLNIHNFCLQEEYKMIYDAVLYYIKSRDGHVDENIYSNQWLTTYDQDLKI